MYIPPHFHEIDPAEIARVLENAPLACVVAQTDQGLLANHLPLLPGPRGSLIGHVALANDMHRILAEGQPVLAIFRSHDAYVTPNAYPSKAEHHRHVPTWNYQVVHMHGTIRFQHDSHAKRAAVALLTRLHEHQLNGDAAWKMADAPPDYIDQMLGAIVAFRIDVTQTLAKSKLSQNREARDHAGVVTNLRVRGAGDVADAMTRRPRRSD